MVQVGFKTNALQWEKKFLEVASALKRNEGAVVRNLAKFAYFYTKGISPYETGALRNAITHKQGKDWFTILSSQPKRRDIRGSVPYHMWMHGIGKYHTMHMIKSGTPTYMFATNILLKELFPNKMNIAVKATISKIIK